MLLLQIVDSQYVDTDCALISQGEYVLRPDCVMHY